MKAAILSLGLLFFLAGCGEPAPETADEGQKPVAQEQAETAAPAPAGNASRIVAVYRPKATPYQPADEAWNSIPASAVPLSAQIITVPNGGGATSEVIVRAVHDGKALSLLLEWMDATADREVGVSTFRDAVAVGFPAGPTDTLPSPFMGDANHPVNIWQWTADFDANSRGQSGFAARYPHTEGVWIFPQDPAITRQVHFWRGTEPVIELSAKGFGTLERHASQAVYGTSLHESGRWRVVLRRQLSTGNPEDTLFRPGAASHIVLAVWNGSDKEVNGRKSVTMAWIPLELEPTLESAAGGAD